MSVATDAPGIRAIMAAAAQGALDQLRKVDPKVLKTIKDPDGKTPLHSASSEGQLEGARYLLSVGVDLNASDKDGWTSLHCAASRGHFAVCELLLNKGAEVRSLTNQGTTVLHYAVRTNLNDAFLFMAVLQLLLEKRADIDAQNQYGETPLHQACFRGNDLAVVWLLVHQADLHHADRKRLTPLHMACMLGHKSTAEILLSQGSDLNSRSETGSVLELAQQSKNEALIAALEEAQQGGGLTKRMQSFVEIEEIVKAFDDGRQNGQTRFLGDRQYLVVKHGSAFKILRLDLTEPVGAWFPYLAQKFCIGDIDEYVIVINPARSSSFALPLDASVVEALRVRDANEVPSDTLYELKRRRRILDFKQGVVQHVVDSLDINEFDKIAKPLVVLFQASGKAQQLLNWAISAEVERTEKGLALFREDSLATKMITNYLKIMGPAYLNRTLGAHIRAMVAANTTWEVDPVRPDWKKGNTKKLQEIVDRFLQSILKSKEHCPSQIVGLCAEVCEVTATKFPECKYPAVGSMMFLRFICPAITSPANYGILEEAPPSSVTRGLVLAAKVIQHLVNGVTFTEKEPYLVKLNKYMEKTVPEVQRFLELISQRSLATMSTPVVVKISEIQENEAATRFDAVLQGIKPKSPKP